MPESTANPEVGFLQFNLSAPIQKALKALGHDRPSAIQAESVPVLLDGKDVLGQAQTGTGKTAAFALPALSKIDFNICKTQVLILVPTRELAIQVAEACNNYGKYISKLTVLPIYGGQGYGHQLKTLNKGAHIVVGTPGRVIDHLKRKTLDLSNIKFLVLDEADEMLRMGFIEDVNWILQHTPPNRQTAVFSATMPKQITKIAMNHMHNPTEIHIKNIVKNTKANITQKYWIVDGLHKLDGLTRILETEKFDGLIIFSRTKKATEELAKNLCFRGYNAVALNGDIAQRQREKTINDIKSRLIDIIVATDVAARGIDLERITHVINFDIPSDIESYTHRIGRTGRAGRQGDAITFISPREKYMLRAIERTLGRKIEEFKIPSIKEVNLARINKFYHSLSEELLEPNKNIGAYKDIVRDFKRDNDVDYHTIAASLIAMLHSKSPLIIKDTGKDKSNRPEKESKNKRRRDNVQKVDFKKPKRKKKKKN